MNETEVVIERVTRVNDTHQRVELAVDVSLSHVQAGQSLLVRKNDQSWEPYLREQWFPVEIGDNRLTIERPLDETHMPGQVLNALGVVGKPMRFRRTLRNVLFIAYDTDPVPLLMPFPALLSNRVSVTLVLLGTATRYGTTHLPPEVEIMHGDSDLEWRDRVITVGWADQVFVTVPTENELIHFNRVRELFKELRADVASNYLFGVFRTLLPCGVGACSACMVRLKKESRLVCTEGPAIDLTEVVMP